MSENTSGATDGPDKGTAYATASPDSTITPDGNTDPQPTAYDRQQDEQTQQTNAEKDAEIAKLREQLAAVQQQSPPDQVSGNVTPQTPDEEAQFHPVETVTSGSVDNSGAAQSGVDQADGVGGTVGSIPVPDSIPAVDVTPAPELSDSQNVSPDTDVRSEDDLREAVGEILTLVREIHETVAWVKTEAPKFGAALAESPFGKMLPGLLSNLSKF